MVGLEVRCIVLVEKKSAQRVKSVCCACFRKDISKLPLSANMVQHDGFIRDLLPEKSNAGADMLHTFRR